MKADWTLRLDRPVELPDGATARTIGDLARYAAALPDDLSQTPEWQFAAGEIRTAAHREGPVLHALIAFCRAMNKDMPPIDPVPRKKAVKKYRIIP